MRAARRVASRRSSAAPSVAEAGRAGRRGTSAGSAGSHFRSLKLLWPAVRSRQVVGTSATRRPASVALTVSSRASSKPALLSIGVAVEERPAVELEVVRRVVGRDAGDPVEAQARRSGSSAASGAARRPGGRRACSGSPRRRRRRRGRAPTIGSTIVRLVGAVGHRDQDVRAGRPGDPGLHRVEDAAAEVVAEAAQRRDLGGEAADDRDRSCPRRSRRPRRARAASATPGVQRPQDRLDGLALVVDGQDDRELDGGVGSPGGLAHAAEDSPPGRRCGIRQRACAAAVEWAPALRRPPWRRRCSSWIGGTDRVTARGAEGAAPGEPPGPPRARALPGGATWTGSAESRSCS